MDLKEIFLESVRSLQKNVMRTALTMLGIIIGISSVILIVSIGQGAVKFITNELSAFGPDFFIVLTGNSPIATVASSDDALTLDDAEAMKEASTNIEAVIPIAIAVVPVTANGVDREVLVRGVTQDAVAIVNPTMHSGQFISEEQYASSSRVAVIGIDTSRDFFGEGTDPVGETIRVDNKPFTIIGLSEAESSLLGGSFNDTIFIPTPVVLDQISGTGDELQQVGVKVKDQDLINSTIEEVSILLRERHDIGEDEDDDFNIQSFRDALSIVTTITGLLTLGVAGVSAISLVVGGVGVMNIMLVTVTERTKEIGLLKSIGAKRNDILVQFLIEAAVITIIGGAIGTAIGLSGALLISLFTPIPFAVSLPAIIIAVGVSALVGIIFGLYPARRAARLSPIEALRYE